MGILKQFATHRIVNDFGADLMSVRPLMGVSRPGAGK
jgi:hypothetical protein